MCTHDERICREKNVEFLVDIDDKSLDWLVTGEWDLWDDSLMYRQGRCNTQRHI